MTSRRRHVGFFSLQYNTPPPIDTTPYVKTLILKPLSMYNVTNSVYNLTKPLTKLKQTKFYADCLRKFDYALKIITFHTKMHQLTMKI